MDDNEAQPKPIIKKLEQDGVLVRGLSTDYDRNKRPYQVVTDGYNCRWNLFGELASYKLQLNKGYLFKYERNGEFKNVKVIEPLANIFEVRALEKLANISEYKKDVGVALRFTTDLIIGGKLELNQLYEKTNEILEYLNKKAESLMPKEVK